MSDQRMVAPGAGEAALISGRLGHAPALDGVRGLAILLVFVMHFRYHPDSTRVDEFINRIFESGWVGVDLFFVLSGFLITGILIEAKSGTRYFYNFYVRRALRLCPVYFGILAVLFVILPMLFGYSPESRELARYQGWYWTYSVNILQSLHSGLRAVNQNLYTTHLWSLSVEEQFYLFWPLVVLIASPRALLRIAGVAVAVACGLRLAVVLQHRDAWLAYALTPARMDALAIGAAVAVLARDGGGSALLRRWWRPAAVFAVAGVLAIAAWQRNYRFWNPAVMPVGYLLNALASGALIAGILAVPKHVLLRPFHWRALQWVGRCSYGAYVYHHLLLRPMAPVRAYFEKQTPIVGSLLPAECAWMLLMGVLTLLLAGASYRWFEMPFLKLKNRFAGHPGRHAGAAEQSVATS